MPTIIKQFSRYQNQKIEFHVLTSDQIYWTHNEIKM